MVKLKDIENWIKTPEFRKGVEINNFVTMALKRNWQMLKLSEVKKVVKEIPDYNPKDTLEAIKIGNEIIVKKYGEKLFRRIRGKKK